jgi:hypothetical protein
MGNLPCLAVSLVLPSVKNGYPTTIDVDGRLAHFAGLAYGDGYALQTEVRIVTLRSEFADKVMDIAQEIAKDLGASSREYVRPGSISDNPQHTITLNSRVLRRALFDDEMCPRYDAMHSIAMEGQLAPDF